MTKRDAVVAGIDPGNDALRLDEGQTEPVHAGVDVNGRAAGPAGAAAKHVPFGKLVEIADHRLGVDLGEGVAAILEKAIEHIDGRRSAARRGRRALHPAWRRKTSCSRRPASARATGATPQP